MKAQKELPSTYDEAINSPDKAKWLKAIQAELNKMFEQKVWRIVKKHNIPNGKRIVGCKWVFDIRKDGEYRARVVAQGFMQVPGIDFKFHHAPVTQDITFHIMLIVWYIKQNWIALQIDIRTAFLYGNLDELIFMCA